MKPVACAECKEMGCKNTSSKAQARAAKQHSVILGSSDTGGGPTLCASRGQGLLSVKWRDGFPWCCTSHLEKM